MIDLAGVLFSTVMVIYVVLRAMKLDRELNWFGPTSKPPQQDDDEQRPPPWRGARGFRS